MSHRNQANKIHTMNINATIRNIRDRNCSSAYCVVPGDAENIEYVR